MTTTTFGKTLKKSLSAFLSFALVFTSTLPITSNAQTALCNASTSYSGGDDRCAAVKIGGTVVQFPKLNWETVTQMQLTRSGSASAFEIAGSDEVVSLANRSASVLNLKPGELANIATTFPANVPYVFGRFNPMDGTLRIDLFKLERGLSNGQETQSLMQAQFTPSHGDHWKANRAYISPEDYMSGTVPGVNPFAKFVQPGSDMFHNITLEGAQVAMGHAMRMAGAPTGILGEAVSRLSSTTSKSGGVFRKKITTRVYGHTKYNWYIAQPIDVLSRSTTYAPMRYCASDPESTGCFGYAIASSGVSFEHFEGGSLNDEETQFLLDTITKTGWTFLAFLVLAVFASFAMTAIINAAGLGTAAAGGGAGTATMGSMGAFMTGAGTISPFTSTLYAIGFEAAAIGTGMVLGGANLGSVLQFKPLSLRGYVDVGKGFRTPPELDGKYERALNNNVAPMTASAMASGNKGSVRGSQLIAFEKTVTGQCDPTSTVAACGVNSGNIPRVDQYKETDSIGFIRENNGRIIRNYE
ncbi:hypothetical protein LC612_31735 [Nostoc sp. CHAB 5834]|nr:hypothetical protein [Nostoc sp. CHAB 5834]